MMTVLPSKDRYGVKAIWWPNYFHLCHVFFYGQWQLSSADQYQVNGRVHHNHPTLTSRCLSKLFQGKGTPTRCVLAVSVMTLPQERSGKNKALSKLVGAKVNWWVEEVTYVADIWRMGAMLPSCLLERSMASLNNGPVRTVHLKSSKRKYSLKHQLMWAFSTSHKWKIRDRSIFWGTVVHPSVFVCLPDGAAPQPAH